MGEVVNLKKEDENDKLNQELIKRNKYLNDQTKSSSSQLSSMINSTFIICSLIITSIGVIASFVGKNIIYSKALEYNIPKTSSFYKFLDYQSEIIITSLTVGLLLSASMTFIYFNLKVKQQVNKQNIDLLNRTLSLKQDSKNNFEEYMNKKAS